MVQGRVRVNGRVVTSLGSRIQPGEDRVEVDGRVVELEPFRWVAGHKEPGTLTTADDPQGRPTVYDDLPEELEGLAYVGRLDLDTSGLLLLSNEGDAVHRMLHPSFEVDREYEATVRGTPDRRALDRLTSGVELEDGVARAAEVELLPGGARGGDGAGRRGAAVVRLVLREGRKREVRRMLDAVGHPVGALRRIRFGPVRLGDLAPGAWRELTAQEVEAIRARIGLTGPDGETDDVGTDDDER